MPQMENWFRAPAPTVSSPSVLLRLAEAGKTPPCFRVSSPRSTERRRPFTGSMDWPPGTDLEASLLSFEKLDRASPDLWPEQLPGVAEFAASFKSPITSSPPKWMAELEHDDIDMLKELGSLTTANLMEKVRGLQNLAYQLGLDESLHFLYQCCS
uniref:Protein lin-52 homolog n=1 Tax=Phascolarctos cinereus TaxID=38626 RepID=A0A6P5KBN5_PHACI|nr:protein lin-52 homolog isoform X2 [Phascolarctos cinereus]